MRFSYNTGLHMEVRPGATVIHKVGMVPSRTASVA